MRDKMSPDPDDLPTMPDREAVLSSNPSQRRPDNRIVAYANELSVLRLVGQYGYLGRAEIARGVWHTTSPRIATEMCQRTVARLLAQKHLKEVGNSFGKVSLILTGRGAAVLQLWDFNARSGSNFAFKGPRFLHRWLGTQYLIERGTQGHSAYGAYALCCPGWAPVGRIELAKSFGQSPDGLVFVRDAEHGSDATIYSADWVKVVASRKSSQGLEHMLSIAHRVGSWLDAAQSIRLDRMLLVCDSKYRSLTGVVKRFGLAHIHANGTAPRIVLVRCHVDLPLIWNGYEEVDCAHLLKTNETAPKMTVG